MSINGSPSASYAYDSIGNMLTKQEGASSLSLNYPTTGSPRPHVVTGVTGTSNLSLTYDENGNLATQSAAEYDYDVENRLASRDIDNGDAYLYTYDGSGSLLRRTLAGPQQTVTLRPNGQGVYGEWSATPNVAHYSNIDEVAADDEATQISRSSAYDSHTYPSAGVPANAVVEQVLLRFRWKAVNGTVGAVVPFFRQNGFIAGSPWLVSLDANWKDEVLSLQYNPVTGKAWTAADVNASMEFGFVGQFAGYSPRVTQAYVEVKYRVPASSTDYVGGIYEKQSDGTETKYYDAGGATAMRVETTAGGVPESGTSCQNGTDDDGDTFVNDGCPMYLLSDHLGGTTKVLNAAGAIVSELKYWPYGAVRSGGVTQTDKLYTGQQQEPGDAALGLYNYKARFYSTTLGRFVSSDSVIQAARDPQLLNRFTYVRNNPLRFSDASGHCVTLPGTTSRLPCDQAHTELVVRCAFGYQGLCGGASDFERSLRILSIWAITQSEFFYGVQGLIDQDRTFFTKLSGIRVDPGAAISTEAWINTWFRNFSKDLVEHGQYAGLAIFRVTSFSYVDVTWRAELMFHDGSDWPFIFRLEVKQKGRQTIEYRTSPSGTFEGRGPSLFDPEESGFRVRLSLRVNRAELETPIPFGYHQHDQDFEFGLYDRNWTHMSVPDGMARILRDGLR